MTVRAVLIGLLGALFIAGLGYLNEVTFLLESFNAGQMVPAIVFGPLVVMVLILNMAFRRFKPGFGFKPRELAVIFVLTLTGVTVPGRSLCEGLLNLSTLPVRYYENRPGWREYELMKYAPGEMFISEGHYNSDAVDPFLGQLGQQGQMIGLGDVPWEAWEAPLRTWLPVFLLIGFGSIAVAMVVHRQWSEHERLRYPVADFANQLMEMGPGGAPASIFTNKVFWLGLGIALSIRVINGIHAWHPGFIQIPLIFNFSQVAQKWPILTQAPQAEDIFIPRIFPIAIAFTFFLSTEVSFSLGISQIAYAIVGITLIQYGVDMSTDNVTGGGMGWARTGSFIAFGLILLYLGRRYYWQVLLQAVTFRRRGEVPRYAGWAARVFLLSMAGVIYILIRLGLDWPFAVIAVLLAMLAFVVVARIVAETGLFYVLPSWTPVGALLGFFGPMALGIKGVIITGIFSLMLLLDPSAQLLPYLVNGLKVSDANGLKVGRVGLTSGITYVLCVALAVPVALWAVYNFPLGGSEWMTDTIPSKTFETAEKAAVELSLAGEVEQSQQLSPLERFDFIRPKQGFLWFAGGGFLAVLIAGFLRLRLPWWPLHPVIFLVWNTHPMKRLSTSLLIGWIIKTAVVRLGGYKAYQKGRPFMVGVIAGELLSAIIFMAYGASYRILTGMPPEEYRALF
jgi:hypothetical protein